MILLIIFLFAFVVAMGAAAFSAWSDFRSMTIPNRYSLIILGAFLPAFIVMGMNSGSWIGLTASHGIAALIMFLVTFGLFAFKLLGAGDSKLGSVLALWIGLKGLPAFLFIMTLVGALLALASLILRKYQPIQNPLAGCWIDQVQQGKSKVPYGIALFVGAFFGFEKAGYFDLAFYQSFLG